MVSLLPDTAQLKVLHSEEPRLRALIEDPATADEVVQETPELVRGTIPEPSSDSPVTPRRHSQTADLEETCVALQLLPRLQDYSP